MTFIHGKKSQADGSVGISVRSVRICLYTLEETLEEMSTTNR